MKFNFGLIKISFFFKLLSQKILFNLNSFICFSIILKLLLWSIVTNVLFIFEHKIYSKNSKQN